MRNGIYTQSNPAHRGHSGNSFGDLSIEVARSQRRHGIIYSVSPLSMIIAPLLVFSGNSHFALGIFVPAFQVVVIQRPIHSLAVERLHVEIIWHHADVDALPVPRRSS